MCTDRELLPLYGKRRCWVGRASPYRNTAGATARPTGAASRWTADVVRLLLAQQTDTGVYWNVNLPDPLSPTDCPEIVFCEMDPHPFPVGYRILNGRYHYSTNYHERPRATGHDVDVCFSGAIAVTRLACRGS